MKEKLKLKDTEKRLVIARGGRWVGVGKMGEGGSKDTDLQV